MSCTLRSIFYFLEDPNRPSVGPHVKMFSFIGLWRNLNSFIGKLKQLLFFVIITFFCSQYVKCFVYFNSDSVKLILQYAPFHMGILKICLFQWQFVSWQKLIEYVSSTERNQLAKEDEKHKGIINNYILINRRVTYSFWLFAFCANFSIFTEPYQKNQINVNGTGVYYHMFDGYTPFRREPPGYYIAMFIQTVLGNVVSAYIVGWDALVVSIMIFFAGQLKICRLYCSETINIADAIESHNNIAKCHRFHTTLVEYQKLFCSLISIVMFAYLINISINLGVCISQIVEIKDDLATLFSSCTFLLACLVQLLLFYWFSNEVTVQSQFTSYGIFESDWSESSKSLQKEMMILGITTNKVLVFTAGPFNVMTLGTFLGILKASYSFYTLLSSTS